MSVEVFENIKLPYPREFVELQIRFVSKVKQLAEKADVDFSWDDLLIATVPIVYTLGFGEGKPNDEKEWNKFVKGIEEASSLSSRISFAKDYYSKRMHKLYPFKENRHYFGCFYYHIHEGNKVFVHFKNRDRSDYGPLSDKRIPARMRELKEMFTYIKNNEPEIREVMSISWIHVLEKYKRLFPKEYTQNMEVYEEIGAFRRFDVWGQFLTQKGRLKQTNVMFFMNGLDKAVTLDDLHDCFELKALVARADIENFYRFHNIKN